MKDEWILISPHRLRRPWQGQTEPTKGNKGTDVYDPNNPLRPGVTRPNGKITEQYTSTYVFENDFPALTPKSLQVALDAEKDELFQLKPARGECKVMCYHPESHKHFHNMTIEEIVKIINQWKQQMCSLGRIYNWVQIFENKGETMGCSNPHPHCQIWASDFIPNEARIKNQNLLKYFNLHLTPLLLDYANKEIAKKERVVVLNEHWVVLVPFWAMWPFETMLIPHKRNILRFTDVTNEETVALSNILKILTTKYDNLFTCSFPYSMGWHGAPTGEGLGANQDHWTFHGIYYPPLVRSATVKKFMVGYEMLAQAQRDLTPEKAADMIKSQSLTHYSE